MQFKDGTGLSNNTPYIHEVICYKNAQEKVAVQSMFFFQMIWNMTLDLCINYRNYFAISFDYHVLVLVIFSILLMAVWLNTKTTKIS